MTTGIILLFGLGLLLIIAEVLIPSFGILGLSAALCILSAIGWAFYEDQSAGMNLMIAAAVLVPIVLTFGIKLFPKSPIGRKLTARGFSFEDGKGVDRRDRGLEGHEGVVITPLRPAGIARIDGRRVDVVSRGELISVDTPVVVVEVSANRVVVARKDSA